MEGHKKRYELSEFDLDAASFNQKIPYFTELKHEAESNTL